MANGETGNAFGIPPEGGAGQNPPGRKWNMDQGFQQPGKITRGLNFLKSGAEKAMHGSEAVLNKIADVLQKRQVFGKPIAAFAIGAAAPGALRMGAKELAKSVVAWSGMAGAVGGGLTGTMAAGAFVGAVSGAVVEYARQVNKNLDTRLAGVTEADPALVGRKKAFLRKMKELRRTEVLKPNDYRKLGRAALFGAVAGAGAGALVEHVPQLSEFIKEHAGGLRSALTAVGDAPAAAVRTAGDVAGAVGRTTGDIAGAAGETIGDAAGTVGGTAGDVLGGASHLPVVGGIGDLAGGVGGAIGETAGAAGRTTGDALGVAGGLTDQLPGVTGAKDLAGGVWGAAGQTTEDLKHAVGLDGAHEAGQEAAKGGEEAVKEAAKAPERFVPETDYNQLQEHAQSLSSQNEDLIRQNNELRQALNQAREGVAAGGTAATAGSAAAQAAAEQATSQAQSALESFGGAIPLASGSNPWEVSQHILSQMGVEHPSPEQIMQLDKVISQENGISVPEWGITGDIDSHKLPVGFKINLTDTVKKTALAIASKK